MRQRLTRRGFEPPDIDLAIARLVADGSLNDRRVAVAAARLETSIKGRGRRRVRLALQRLGIDEGVAEAALAEVLGEVSEADLLDRALARRLRGVAIDSLDLRGRARLARGLIARGFDPAQVFARLRRGRHEADE